MNWVLNEFDYFICGACVNVATQLTSTYDVNWFQSGSCETNRCSRFFFFFDFCFVYSSSITHCGCWKYSVQTIRLFGSIPICRHRHLSGAFKWVWWSEMSVDFEHVTSIWQRNSKPFDSIESFLMSFSGSIPFFFCSIEIRFGSDWHSIGDWFWFIHLYFWDPYERNRLESFSDNERNRFYSNQYDEPWTYNL